MRTIKNQAFLRHITLSLNYVLYFVITILDFALLESTWRTVRSQELCLPDADRVRHCTCQTPEISVLQFCCSAVSGILIDFDTLM